MSAPEDVKAIKDLVQVCESEEGISLDFGWDALPYDDATRLWTCRGDEELLGAGLVYRTGRSAEVALMVHPSRRRQGIGSRLIGSILEDCRAKSMVSVLLVGDRHSQSGAGIKSNLGAAYSRSEFRMESTTSRDGELEAGIQAKVQLTEATNMDLERLVTNKMECLGMSEDEREAVQELTKRRLDSPKYSVYLITDVEGLVTGQLTLSFEAINPYVYGLCVLPQLRGRGYGGAALRLAVMAASVRSRVPVRLEVETANDNALKVYKRAGFQTIATFDYHELNLD